MSTISVTEVARPRVPPGRAVHRRRVDGRRGSRGDDVINPATGAVLGRVPFAEPKDVDRAIAAASAAFAGMARPGAGRAFGHIAPRRHPDPDAGRGHRPGDDAGRGEAAGRGDR